MLKQKTKNELIDLLMKAHIVIASYEQMLQQAANQEEKKDE